MPEGDSVWRQARLLGRGLAGQRLLGSDFRVPRYATLDLSGSDVVEVVSRGKHLLIRLDAQDRGPLTVHSQLLMEGRWSVVPRDRAGRLGDHTIRLVMTVARSVAVGRRLHGVEVVATAAEQRLVGHLGPDLLGAWDRDEAVRRLRLDQAAQIGAALLDQRNLAGVGNVYKCEVLFLLGVWPWTPVSEVGDLPRLVDVAHRLLTVNRDSPVRSTTGRRSPGETTYVYGRGGRPCRRCGTTIRTGSQRGGSSALGSADRVTYWCPRCQPEP